MGMCVCLCLNVCNRVIVCEKIKIKQSLENLKEVIRFLFQKK